MSIFKNLFSKNKTEQDEKDYKELEKEIIAGISRDENRSEAMGKKKGKNYRNLRVLAVDDTNMILTSLDRNLSEMGVHGNFASDGFKAIEMCKNCEYDLIFMDLMMPEMDGVETMQNIRAIGGTYAEGGDCKFVTLTSNQGAGLKNQMLAVGFDEFIAKPASIKTLKAVIDSVL